MKKPMLILLILLLAAALTLGLIARFRPEEDPAAVDAAAVGLATVTDMPGDYASITSLPGGEPANGSTHLE